jgi:hypothetical protein
LHIAGRLQQSWVCPGSLLRIDRNIPGRQVFRDLNAGGRGGRNVVGHAPFCERCNLSLLPLIATVRE